MRVRLRSFGFGAAHQLGADPERTLCGLPLGERPTEALRTDLDCHRCAPAVLLARLCLAESAADADHHRATRPQET